MTKSEWKSQISSTSARERLTGVRWLSEHGGSSALSTLRLMRRDEPDSWVQRAIDQAVQRHTGETYSPHLDTADVISGSSQRIARADEVQRIAKIFVHEVSHLTGAAISGAMRDLGVNYKASETAHALDRISEFLGVLEQLHDAASSPIWHEFNLSECVRRAASQVAHEPAELLFARDDQLLVVGDEIRLRLALVNVIRNGVEASRERGGRTVISWAATESGYWVSVLDQGPGLPDGFAGATAPGATTKDTAVHFGWGLTVAAQALETFGASLSLVPAATAGVLCQIRWAKRGLQET